MHHEIIVDRSLLSRVDRLTSRLSDAGVRDVDGIKPGGVSRVQPGHTGTMEK